MLLIRIIVFQNCLVWKLMLSLQFISSFFANSEYTKMKCDQNNSTIFVN